jgi:hypothetical protein
MAINLAKPAFNPFTKKPSTSWGEFYFNVAIDMLEGTLINRGISLVSTDIADAIGNTSTKVESIVNDVWFAKSLSEEYDKVIKGGKTIIGGVPFTGGNVILMTTVLSAILQKTKADPNGDLLRDIGPAVQAYWLGNTSAKFPTPSVPCIGAVKNLTTTIGLNLSPGVWTPISVPTPMNEPWPFLINFIISANLHLLTVGGMFVCNAQYPPPAPPAPGVLPWVGYITNPLSAGPFTGKTWKDILKVVGATTAQSTVASVINLTADGKDLTAQNIGTQLTAGLLDTKNNASNVSPVEKDALAALSTGDENKIAAASQALNANKKV